MNKLIILFLIATFISCDRNSEEEEEVYTEFSGKVYDKETLDSIPGANIIIVRVDRDNPGIVLPFESTVADSLGEYHYSFAAENSYYYYAYASSGNYLFDHYDIIQTGRVSTLNFSLLKPGYLAIHVKNTSPIDSLDNINIFDSDYYHPQHNFAGMTVDTILIITSYGNQSNPVNWKVTKNDTTITYNQTFNYISLDTISFDLFY